MTSPLQLPLETIERILFFAFRSDLPLSTPSPKRVTPPRKTSHLLLVAKGITALCLPLYWRSVTILRADDWVKLWHPEMGLFAGERGHQRASWVTEIRVNTAARAQMPVDLPLVQETYGRGEPPHRVLVKLAAVPLPLFRNVCFFTAGKDAEYDGDVGYELQFDEQEKQKGRLTSGDVEFMDAGQKLQERLEEIELERELDDLGLEGSERDAAREVVWEDLFGYGEDEPLSFELLQQLKSERDATLIELLRSPLWQLASVRMSIDSDIPFGLYLPRPDADINDPLLERRAATVYPSFSDPKETVRIFKDTLTRERADYDFARFSRKARTKIVAKTRHAGEHWRWVEKDGSLSPFKPAEAQ